MALDKFVFMMPEDNDEKDSDGKKIYKPLVMMYKDDKTNPGCEVKPKSKTYVPIVFDYEKEFKILEAEKRKRQNSNQKSKSPFPPSVNSNGKRRHRADYSGSSNSAKSKRRSITSSPRSSSTKRSKLNTMGVSSKAKKNLFTLYDEYKQKPSTGSKIKNCNFDEHQEPKLLPDSDGNSSDLFEQYELECGIVPKSPAPVSPLSAITSKLESTSISNSSLRFDVGKLKLEINQCVKTYESRHEADMLKIRAIQQKMEADKNKFISKMSNKLKELDQLRNQLSTGSSNKEYQKVVRLASPTRKLTTPKSATHNLRIATLNKNLQRSAKKEGQTDKKMEKAVNYYNTIRSNYSLLSTPKTKRNELMDPRVNLDETISLKLQRQCLMLVDTPVHN